MEKIWDVLIVGAGPAGLTAAIYCSRLGHTTLILNGGKVGGRALEAHHVDNFPGFPNGISGLDLMDLFHRQAVRFGAQIRRETVIGLTDNGDIKMVSTRGGYHQTKAIIIATGIKKKQLSVIGENEYKGRGVSYCAICDGPFFKGKTVTVVGGGYEAIVDSLHLSEIADKVYAIPGMKGYIEESQELALLRSNPKITVLPGEVLEIGGGESVEYVKVRDTFEKKIDTDGVFILLESISTSTILTDIGIITDKTGCITIDRSQQTNIPGIFAAGDCVCQGWQIVTAAGDGAKAAMSAVKYIKNIRV